MIRVASAGFAQGLRLRGELRATTSRRCAALPGVKAASLVSNIPLSGGGSSNGFQAKPGAGAEGHDAGQQLRRRRAGARGARRQADRGPAVRGERDPAAVGNLRDSRRRRSSPQAFAKELFPKDPNPLGKTFYDGLSRPITIVGVIEHMHGAWVGWDKLDNVMLFPRIKNGPTGDLPGPDRARPARRGDARTSRRSSATRTRAACSAGSGRSTTSSTQSTWTTATWRSSSCSVTSALLAITALGIFGLATFNVKTRIRQIGTRRAVGARKLDIVRHFLRRELDDHDRRRRRRLRRRARHRLLDLGQVRAAARSTCTTSSAACSRSG